MASQDADFRAFLDERFKRVDDALANIRDALRQQEANRAMQFAALEARYTLLENRVEASDGRMKIVASLSAGIGAIVGALLGWVGHFAGILK